MSQGLKFLFIEDTISWKVTGQYPSLEEFRTENAFTCLITVLSTKIDKPFVTEDGILYLDESHLKDLVNLKFYLDQIEQGFGTKLLFEELLSVLTGEQCYDQ